MMMSHSTEYYEQKLDEAQEREYALEDQISKLKDQIAELEDENKGLRFALSSLNLNDDGVPQPMTLKLESEMDEAKNKIDEAIEKAVREHRIAINKLTERQVCDVFKQAIACGDIQKLVVAETGAQQVIYLPFAREQELMARIRELEDELDKIPARE